ncbi:ABC transporter permease [Flavobacterium sp.]|uniref:ABC transporter permease n=1 Tax=Flavobacterium sp. TaxID=239 RepID=UPI00260E7546|nr:ABC transporter permease [Flavobacterium sp.]
MKQFNAFVKKEFFHVFRDSKTLLMLFGLPIVMITLFGFALTNEIKNSKIVICDYAKDIASQRITEKLKASSNFIVEESIISHNEIEAQFKTGKIKLVIVFPNNFNESLQRFGTAKLQVIADASDPNTASTLTSYVNNIVNSYQKEIATGTNGSFQVVPETRMLYNPELKGATNYVPGVMALVLLLVCVLMTSVSIVREKELGTMEVLLVSPVNPFLIIIAKALPYFTLSIVNFIIIIIMCNLLLEIPVKGSILLLFGITSIFIVCCLSLGLLISNSTQSQQIAMLTSLMGMLMPTLLFTGFMFPIENMPVALQVVSNVVPSRWYYTIVKSIMIKGLGFSAIWKETLILVVMTILLLGISFKKFKIRLA